jgi:hypothetical protein
VARDEQEYPLIVIGDEGAETARSAPKITWRTSVTLSSALRSVWRPDQQPMHQR